MINKIAIACDIEIQKSPSSFLYFFLKFHHLEISKPHNFNLLEGTPSRNNNFNSMFQQNLHDEDDVHVQDHVYNHDQYHHQQPNVVTDEEKRLRRMASNRESARRTRMRERMMKEGLQMQVKQLMAYNQFLYNKYISLLEYNHQILQENSQLKETVSSFHDQYTISYGNHEGILGNTNDFDLNQLSSYQPS